MTKTMLGKTVSVTIESTTKRLNLTFYKVNLLVMSSPTNEIDRIPISLRAMVLCGWWGQFILIKQSLADPLRNRAKKKTNIQQPVFAGGHPPNY
jgi:hypothetical protein